MAKEFRSAWFDRISVKLMVWVVVLAILAAMAVFGR